MTSEELYYQFNLLINKNASLENVNVPKANFVILYNREALYWLNNFIDVNSSTENIHDIQGLLKVDEKLNLIETTPEYYEYFLPERYFNFVDSKSHVSKNNCLGVVYNYLQKPKEILVNLDYQRPSFKFEESICNITENKLRVYVQDYKINSTYLSYYLIPEKIDLEGYININTGEFSKNVDSSLADLYQLQILDRVKTEVFREFENINAFNLTQKP